MKRLYRKKKTNLKMKQGKLTINKNNNILDKHLLDLLNNINKVS